MNSKTSLRQKIYLSMMILDKYFNHQAIPLKRKMALTFGGFINKYKKICE